MTKAMTQATTSKRAYGASIEALAERFVVERGLRVIGRNFGRRTGEIDLIAEDRDSSGGIELVFFEVRARRSGSLCSGIESVDRRKQSRLVRTARGYLQGYRGPAQGIRFDILDWDGHRFQWLKSARVEP